MGLDYDSSLALGAKALLSGATMESAIRLNWDLSGGCNAPVTFEHFARPQQWFSDNLGSLIKKSMRDAFSEKLVDRKPVRGFASFKGGNTPIWIILDVRCRKCAWCLRQRAREWQLKALSECERASRTWFATLTMTPDEHFRLLSIARMRAAEASAVFEEKHSDDQFRELCRAAAPDITRYVKRIRKESGAPIRYLIVAERHASGLPHWHALIHEVHSDKPIRKAVLKGQWRHGHSLFKLCDDTRPAWYVCKYLAKEIATRVRSSLRYGKENIGLTPKERERRDDATQRNAVTLTLPDLREAIYGLPGSL